MKPQFQPEVCRIRRLLAQFHIGRKKPHNIGGYPPDLAPQRLVIGWLEAYDRYRVELIGKIPEHALRGPHSQVKRMLMEKDGIAARLAEKAVALRSMEGERLAG